MPIWDEGVFDWINTVGPQDRDFLLDRIEEEIDELKEAIAQFRKAPAFVPNKAHLLGEMMDVFFTSLVFTETLNWDAEGAFDEKCASNMSKVVPDIIRREDGKIMKGPNYMPANMDLYV